MTDTSLGIPPRAPLALLIEQLAEVTAEGRLAGNFQDYVLLADVEHASEWLRIAPHQPFSTFSEDDRLRPCIVFAVDGPSRSHLAAIRAADPKRIVYDFFEEYLPALMARTFDPSRHVPLKDIGTGIVIFHTPRTGGHFLMSMMAACHDFGETEEWVRPPVVTAVKLGILNFVDHLKRCASYQRANSKHWSNKMDIPFLADIWVSETDTQKKAFLSFLGLGHAFLLSRVNKLAQIWSTIKAVNNGVFFELNSDELPIDSIIELSSEPSIIDLASYWFWTTITIEKIRLWENMAISLAKDAGLQLETVLYEELLEEPINSEIHQRVFGPFYENSVHVLRKSASQYKKQSRKDDEQALKCLKIMHDSIIVGIQDGYLKNPAGSIISCGGHTFIKTDGIYFEDVSLIISNLFPTSIQDTTAVVEFCFSGSETINSFLSVEVVINDLRIFSYDVKSSGSYVLMYDISSTPPGAILNLCFSNCRVNFPPIGASGRSIFQILKAYHINISFNMKQVFSWFNELERTERVAIYKMTTY